MMLIEGGAVAWSADPLATVIGANAYATARGWADWLVLNEARKAAAILDASAYVRVSFTAPQITGAAVDAAVSNAVIEAARLTLTGPLLGGDLAGSRAQKAVRAGSVSVEYESGSTASLRNARLALVNGMLRAAGAYGAGGLNVRLVRS